MGKKGQIAWNKGKRYGHKEICPECEKEFFVYPHLIKKGLRKFCSRKCSSLNRWKNQDFRQKMTNNHKGIIPIGNKKLIEYAKSDKGREEVSLRFKGKNPWNKGLTKNTDIRLLSISGINNYKWIEDRTQLKEQGDRRSPKYKDWVKRVKDRDNWKCRIDNCDCKGKVIAHHILGYANYPELRYDINNGITLCQAHHPRKRKDEQMLIPTFKELVEATVLI